MKLFNNAMIMLALLALFAVSTPSYAQDSLRQTLFEEAQDTLSKANRAKAPLLAPRSYLEGAGHFKRAEGILEKGGNLDRIRTELAKAVAAWNTAIEATKVSSITLAKSYRAREDALSADAKSYAPDAWSEGERLFQEATINLEKGSLSSAGRLDTRAEEQYRAAELAAIKANYLNETLNLLAQADRLKAKRYAPNTFAKANGLYAEAEKELTENRYDTDRPRSLAQDAKHQAKLAIYLAENLRRVDRDRGELENLLLDWQTPVKRIGASLDMPVYFDEGYEDATGSLVTRIEEVLATNRVQAQDLSERKEQLRGLQTQIAALEERLGGASQERLALAAQLDHQARIKEKFASVEKMFDRDEAVVLRSGSQIILRMVGLTFDSAQAEIKPEWYGLLGKVERAIRVFDQSTIEVEGHTDSFGSDENNLELSADRSTAVKTYLMSSMGLSDSQVRATGFGEASPIANNETPEGREKNRRTDIIINTSLR